MNSKPFKIIVYGASGFTGQQAALSLGRESLQHNFKLGLAGRNRDKLEAVQKRISAELGCHSENFEVIVADCQDRDALSKLVASTEFVANLAGPFVKYAPLLIEQCALQGVDYVDITGETAFIHHMIKKHHDQAVKSKARIIPFCGFDSIPSDLGSYWAFHEWSKSSKKEGESCQKIQSLFQMKGGFNGGTLATALEMAKSPDFEAMSKDLWLLCPSQTPRPPAKPDSIHPEKIRELGCYSAPFFMAPINTRVVRRSQSLFGGDYRQFEYAESLLIREKLPLASSLISLFGAISEKALKMRLTRSWIESLVPKPGSGPSVEVMDCGFFKTTFLVKATQGSIWKGRISGKGDPGNRATIQMMTEAALCLALPELRGQIPTRFGFLTPSYAFENVLLNRLQQSGIQFEVID